MTKFWHFRSCDAPLSLVTNDQFGRENYRVCRVILTKKNQILKDNHQFVLLFLHFHFSKTKHNCVSWGPKYLESRITSDNAGNHLHYKLTDIQCLNRTFFWYNSNYSCFYSLPCYVFGKSNMSQLTQFW